MDDKSLESLIMRLEIVQLKLSGKRRDYHGIVPYDKKDDIEAIQVVIEIIKNLIIDKDYIWRNKNTK